MLPFHKIVADDFHAVNELIVSQLHSEVELIENIGEYIVDGGGKRLRPLVVLLSALTCNFRPVDSPGDHVRLATIIEYVHTATLLHDDVVDTSDLRRGRPTANAKWGNSHTVLVGDFLYSRVFQMLVALGNVHIMRLLADTTNTIAEGEVQQLVNASNPDVDETNYLGVIRKKTAALFEAACAGGAMLVAQNNNWTSSLASYGHHLGMAYQIQDDLLDYAGDAEDMGKNVGDDLAEGKPTLPLIFAMQHAGESESRMIRDAIRTCNSECINQVIATVQSCGALDYTREQAQQHSEKAKTAVGNLPGNKFRSALEELADFATNRSY